VIINLAISLAFTTIDYDGLRDLFPVHMDVDYIRVYQDPDNKVRLPSPDLRTLSRTFSCTLSDASAFLLYSKNIGCDPVRPFAPFLRQYSAN
jgi:hypothetical protein